MAKMYVIKKFTFTEESIKESTIQGIPLLEAKDAIQVAFIMNSYCKGTDTLYQIAPTKIPLMK